MRCSIQLSYRAVVDRPLRAIGGKDRQGFFPTKPRSEKLAQIRNPHRLGLLVSPPRCPLPMRILQANPTGGVGLAFWALTPKPSVLSHFRWSSGKFPNARGKDLSLLSKRVVHAHLAGVCCHTQTPPPLSGAGALCSKPQWVGCFVATRSCRDGSLLRVFQRRTLVLR